MINGNDLRTSPPRWWSTTAMIVGAVVVLVVLVLRVKGVGLWSHDAGGVESNVIHGIQKLMLGRPLYEDCEKPTYDVIQYAPLYYWIAAASGKLLAVDPLEPIAVFKLSRTLSLLFNLGAVLLFFRMLRERGTHRAAAFFLTAVMLVSLTRHFFSRPDSLYFLCFLLGLRSFLRYLEVDDAGVRRHALIGLLCWSIAGLWAKQSGVLLPGLAGLQLLLMRRWRDAILLAAGTIALIAGSITVLAWIHGLEPLRQNMITGLRNGISTELYRIVFGTPNYLFLAGLHLVGAVYCATGLRSAETRSRFLGLGIVASFLFAMITGMKSGSRMNYFIENFAFIYLSIGLVAVEFRSTAWQRRWPALVLVAGALFLSLRARELRAQLNWTNLAVSDRSRYDDAAHVAAFLRENGLEDGRYVYIVRRGFLEHFLSGNSILNQKDIIHYSDRALFDYSDLFARMKDGRVRFIVSDRPLDTLRLFDRSFTGCEPVAIIDGQHVLLNKASR